LKNLFVPIALSAMSIGLAGCLEERAPTAASREARQTEFLANQAAVAVGMPAINNFTEKRQLKTIYELRDMANLVTYSYTLDLNGNRHKICPSTSVGFGIPYATQFTSPTAMQRWYLPRTTDYIAAWGEREASQPEPNGLHMPSSADATWVICLHPNGKDLSPTYVEPRTVVYLFEMPSVD
jgi:hypothetical protein